jgi:hypothetical protein
MPLSASFPLAAAGLALLLAGCGGDRDAGGAATDGAPPAEAPAATRDAPPAATAPTDACTLASADEVRETAGVAGPGVSARSGGASVCTWSDEAGRSAVVQLFRDPADFERAREAFEGMYGAASPLPGVGDDAFVLGGRTGPIPTATVAARAGDSVVSVQVMAMDGAEATLRDQAVALTRVVVGRL